MGAALAAILNGPDFPWLAASAALAGLSRGFTGFGAAMIFVPLAAIWLPPITVIVLLHFVDLGASAVLTRGALRTAKLRPVVLLIAGVCVGLPLGFRALEQIDPLIFRWMTPLLVLTVLAVFVSGWRYRGEPGDASTLAVGGISGLAGGLTGMMGPPVLLFFLGGPERAVRMRASVILFLLLATPLGFVVFALRGAISWQAVNHAVLLAPVFTVAVILGAGLFRLAGERDYRYVSYCLVALAAVLALPLWSGS